MAPTFGELKRLRALVCYANSSNVCVGAGGSWTRKLFSDALLSYDGYGNLTSSTTYSGYGYQQGTTLVYASGGPRTASSSYDTAGYNTYRTGESNAAGHAMSWIYNYRLGVPVQETDANNIVTSAEYDAFGRLAKIIRPGDSSATPTVWIKYLGPGAANNQPFFISLSGPHQGGTWVQRKVYDGLVNLLQTQVGNAQVNGSAQDVIVDYEYNGYGQVVKQTVPYTIGIWNGSGTAYRGQQLSQPGATTSYDGLGRVTLVQSPTSAEKATYSYPDDLQVQVCDGRNNCTATTHDLWGRVAEVRPPADPWLKYSYDEAGAHWARLGLVEKRTGSGSGTLFAQTSMSYDLAGRKTGMSDPDLGNWSYSYDGAHNLATQTDARQCRTTLSYDLLNRVTQKSYAALAGGSCGASTTTVTYSYDAVTPSGNKGKGKRTAMSDGSGSATWEYGDARGRLTKESKSITGGGSFVTQWSYDAADQVVTLTYPDGESVAHSYLPQRLVNSVGSYLAASFYDAAGRPTERRLMGDAVRTSLQYFPWTSRNGRLAQLRSGTPANYLTTSPLQHLEYDYDAVGNITIITDHNTGGTVQTQAFSYDSLDRLLTAGVSGGTGGLYSESYSYFTNGRMQNGPLGSGYAYNDAAHKHAVTAVGSNGFAYDANGNMTSRSVGGQSYTLTYNAENQLVSVSGAASASFVYDGDGVRVKGTVGGVTSYYPNRYYEVTDGVVKKYYYAGNQRIAIKDGGTNRTLLGDHLGSTAYTISGTSKTGELRYRAFGVTRFTSGTTPTTYRYTGQREESGLGLYYYGARWYDPALGHFIQPDTIVPDPANGLDYHRYGYVRFNPLKYNDPTGHQASCMVDQEGNWNCNPNATTGGHTLTIDLRDEPPPCPNNDCSGKDLALLLGGMFAGSMLIAAAPPVLLAAGGAACRDGDCTNEVSAATQSSQSVWKLRPFERGKVIERLLGRGTALVDNFPTIDKFDFRTGTATSIKSLDLSLKSYQNISTLTREVRGYIDKLANWQGQTSSWAGVRILPNQVTSKVLELAIPPNASQAQLNALRQLQQYASNVNVTFVFVPVD